MKIREKTGEIQEFIIDNIEAHSNDIARVTAEQFSISRAAVARHLSLLVKRGVVATKGNTKARSYELIPSVHELFTLEINESLSEDVIWRERVSPLLGEDSSQNVRDICNYGFTEMLNNAIDHSESDTVSITVRIDASTIRLVVKDFGIGVFKKLMRDFKLLDPRHALLELSKGKLTTDASKHSGQGIFFTSRMFDQFLLDANGFSFCRFNKNDDWLFESSKATVGTMVMMKIGQRAPQLIANVMSEYSAELHDYGFTKTHVPLELAKYEGEQLVSRSQARRLLARVDQFKEVWLDFKGLTTIGQAFADEVFRVFKINHPSIVIIPTNANEEIKMMIQRAQGEVTQQPEPSLFDGLET